MTSEQTLKGHLDAMVLAIVEDVPLHGYGVIEELRRRSGGVFDLPGGTVYPALHRLERQGLLTSDREQVGGRERRVYRVSPRGRRKLSEDRSGWTEFAGAVSMVLEGSVA
jgi:DNA-binding PadR family transcriptional regulator